MPILSLLCLSVELFFAIHVIRTDRERYWIYVIMIPGIGCLLYFFTQFLPDMGHHRGVVRTGRKLIKAIDPQRELRQRKEALVLSDTVENRIQLANECVEAGLHDDAIELYQSCLKGMHETDPHIMLKLAMAWFDLKRPEKTKQLLESLLEKNPEFQSLDGHLLYARALEQLSLNDAALAEYQVLSTSFPGEEARVRYALLLFKTGEVEAAKRQFDETILRAKRAPKYYRKKEKAWITIAREH